MPAATFAAFLTALWRGVSKEPPGRDAAALAQSLDERLAALEAGGVRDDLAKRLEAVEHAQARLSELVQSYGLRLAAVSEASTAAERQAVELARRIDGADRAYATLVAQVGGLDAAVAGLTRAPPPGPAAPSRGMVDLMTDLRGEVAQLFQTAERGGPGEGVVIEGVDVEIRGDLALEGGIGIRPYEAGKTGPEAASTLRFTLRPEVRIETPPAEAPSPPEPASGPAAPEPGPSRPSRRTKR